MGIVDGLTPTSQMRASATLTWGEGSLYVRLDADRFFTYSRTPKDFPG